jgi:hypothetical protein
MTDAAGFDSPTTAARVSTLTSHFLFVVLLTDCALGGQDCLRLGHTSKGASPAMLAILSKVDRLSKCTAISAQQERTTEVLLA